MGKTCYSLLDTDGMLRSLRGLKSLVPVDRCGDRHFVNPVESMDMEESPEEELFLPIDGFHPSPPIHYVQLWRHHSASITDAQRSIYSVLSILSGNVRV